MASTKEAHLRQFLRNDVLAPEVRDSVGPSPAQTRPTPSNPTLAGPPAGLDFSRYSPAAAAFLGQHVPRPEARPLDPGLTTARADLIRRLQALSDQVFHAALARGDASDRPTNRDKIFRAVFILALNLIDALRVQPDLCVGMPFRANWYSEDEGAEAAGLSHKFACKVAYPEFVRLGLVEEIAGGFADRKTGHGETTRIRGTPQLQALLTPEGFPQFWEITRTVVLDRIVLRDEKKRDMPFEETALTLQARENLLTINGLFHRHLIDLRLPDSGYASLHLHRKSQDSLFDLSRFVLHRTFNNASLVRSDVRPEGGRFYGGWWQELSEKLRTRITIDGEPTEEIDYSAFQPSLAYHQLGLNPPDEPYIIPSVRMSRDAGKLALIAMLNAKSPLIPKPDDFDWRKAGMPWDAARRLIEQHHAPLRHLFYTGEGLRLQFTDSQIAEKIMLHFAARDIVCLPIHDSFIVQRKHADELEAVMEEIYRLEVGFLPKLKRLPVETWNDEDGGYDTYDRRQAAWKDRLKRMIP